MPSDLHDALYQAYLDELRETHPKVRIIKKGDSPFCRFIDKVLKVVTFGGQRRFLDSFTTTFGNRIYVPDCWWMFTPGDRYCTLRHELVHVEQFKRYTWPGMILLYIFLPLPAGFAGGRAYLEWEAYRESLVATWQVHGELEAKSPWLKKRIVGHFTGPEYGWMWVKGSSISTRYDKAIERLEASPPPPLPEPLALPTGEPADLFLGDPPVDGEAIA